MPYVENQKNLKLMKNTKKQRMQKKMDYRKEKLKNYIRLESYL